MEDDNVTIDDNLLLGLVERRLEILNLPDHGKCVRIVISYTLHSIDTDYVHSFEFYNNDFSEEHMKAWIEFIDFIAKNDDEKGSLVYHIKRNGEVMREFVALNMISKYAPAA